MRFLVQYLLVSRPPYQQKERAPLLLFIILTAILPGVTGIAMGRPSLPAARKAPLQQIRAAWGH